MDSVWHLLQYHDTDTLLDGLENNTKRYIRIVCEAADNAMPVPTSRDFEEDIYDILYNQACMATSHSLWLHIILNDVADAKERLHSAV